MIAVGIDPGTRVTGIVALTTKPRKSDAVTPRVILRRAVLAESWRPSPTSLVNPETARGKRQTNTDPARLFNLVLDVCREIHILMRYGELVVAIEEPFVGANGATALRQHGLFSAIVVSLFPTPGIKAIVPVWPATIKKFVGAKKKSLLIREVYKRWSFSSESEDIVDAYAIARWCLETQIEPKKG